MDDAQSFGIMFQLGKELGTLIIPIDLENDYFENNFKEVSRVQRYEYSNNIKLVNYFIDEEDGKNLLVDLLSSEPADKYDENSEELFYSLMEDDKLFNEITNTLLEQYQKYVH